jgi:hypothetical protein
LEVEGMGERELEGLEGGGTGLHEGGLEPHGVAEIEEGD